MAGKRFYILLALLAGGIGWIDVHLWQLANFRNQIGKVGGIWEPVDRTVSEHMQQEWTRLALQEKMEKADKATECGDAAIQLYNHLGEMGLSQQQPAILTKFLNRFGDAREGKVWEGYKLLIERLLKERRTAEAEPLIRRAHALAEKPPPDIGMLKAVAEWAQKAGMHAFCLEIAEKYYNAAHLPAETRMRFANLLIAAYEAHQQTEKANEVRQRLAEYERQQKMQRLEREIMAAFAKKDYAGAEKKCRDFAALAPESPHGWYNLACALARQDKNEAAMAELTKAVERGFADAVHMRLDDDLASLRSRASFSRLLDVARAKERELPRESIAVGEGMRCVERDPADGFCYTLIMPAAETQKPRRLLLWLPPGPLMKEFILPALPTLLESGCAVMIMTRRQFQGLSASDVERLLNATLPDAAQIPGIDAEQPMIFGYGFGGQAALWLWSLHPDRIGGLILHNAYPIDLKKYAETGHGTPMALPKAPAQKMTPVYALAPKAQGATQFWRQEEGKWRKAGVPLTLRLLSARQEEWRLTEEEFKDIAAWLKAVLAGERPGLATPKK